MENVWYNRDVDSVCVRIFFNLDFYIIFILTTYKKKKKEIVGWLESEGNREQGNFIFKIITIQIVYVQNNLYKSLIREQQENIFWVPI